MVLKYNSFTIGRSWASSVSWRITSTISYRVLGVKHAIR